MKNLFEAVSKVSGEIKNPARNKEVIVKHKSGGSHKFKYAPLDKIIEATRKLLSKNGLSIMQSVEPIEGKDYLVTQINHVSGEFIRSLLPFGPIPTEPQQYGARLTYIKRYGYCAALNIASEDDNDAPDKLTGKLNKSKLRSEIAKFAHGISEKDTSKELMEHYTEFLEAITQAKVDMPELLTGVDGGGICVEDNYRTSMTALVSMEKQDKANTENFKNTVGA